jgi:hypothetical protein
MKPRYLSLLALALILSVGTASAKNRVYKGSYTTRDSLTKKTQSLRGYLVLGDEVPINGGETRYAHITGTLVVTGKPLPAKRYAVIPFGLFRTLEIKQMIGNKERTFEIITLAEAEPTAGGNGFHRLSGIVLTGQNTNPLYEMPEILRGNGLSSNGQLSPSPEAPIGGASTATLSYTLVPDLTDPIPGAESLADSVKRVTDFLEDRGYIAFVP